jgi:glycosyltransferase involved in cell wall biosynthesis
MKILAIVPSFNEEKNIIRVIESIRHENSMIDILIVNDGSEDKTGAKAKSTGLAFVADLPCNLGIGGAIQTGFKFAKKHDYDIAFQFDGDGQHVPSEIDKLIGPIQKQDADVVIGSRFCEKQRGFRSTILRRIGIKVFEMVNSLIIKQRITDNTSGFRAYNRKAIGFLADNYPMDYPEPEAIILLGRNGFRLRETPVRMQERARGSSSIKGLRPAYYMIKVLLAILMTTLRPRLLKDHMYDKTC